LALIYLIAIRSDLFGMILFYFLQLVKLPKEVTLRIFPLSEKINYRTVLKALKLVYIAKVKIRNHFKKRGKILA